MYTFSILRRPTTPFSVSALKQSNSEHQFSGVDSFGIVYLKSTGPAKHTIRPIDPVKYPDQQDIHLKVPDQVKFELKDNNLLELDVENATQDAISSEIQVPMKYGRFGDHTKAAKSYHNCNL